jgi:lipoate-protein ligase A
MPEAPESWRLLESGPGPAAYNMALDELLLETARTRGAPVLRFYGWTEPAASFGYFQRFAEVERLTLLRPLIRRPTGGGLVPHDRDWTYSLVFPPGHAWHGLRAAASYQRLHAWVRDTWTTFQIPTQLAPAAQKATPGQCFVGADRFDVLWHGRKIAGAAQRRNRCGLLIQGSLQPPPAAPARSAWERAFRQQATSNWRVTWVLWSLEPDLEAQARELARHKYAAAAHNQRR